MQKQAVKLVAACFYLDTRLYANLEKLILNQQAFAGWRPDRCETQNPNPFLGSDFDYLVEMAGIEPASENQSLQASPGAVGLFKFPHRNAVRQAFRFGIP